MKKQDRHEAYPVWILYKVISYNIIHMSSAYLSLLLAAGGKNDVPAFAGIFCFAA